MSKISLTNLVNLQNETTAVNAINANSAIIQTAFDNTLSRDGTSPNQMGATLDMNSHSIINLPAPVNNTDAARLIDIIDSSGSAPIRTVFGRVGDVVAQSNDYTFAQIGSKPTTVAGYGITNAVTNLTGPITSVQNATSIASQTGTGTKFVMDTSPTITGTLTAATVNVSGIFASSNTTSGTSSTAAAITGKSLGLTENATVGGVLLVQGISAFQAALSLSYGSPQLSISDNNTSFAFMSIRANPTGGFAGLRFGQEGAIGGQLVGGSAAGDGVFTMVDNKRMLFGAFNQTVFYINPSGGVGVNTATDPGAGGVAATGRVSMANFTVNNIGGNSWGTTSTFPSIGLYYNGNLPAATGFVRLWQTDINLSATANNDVIECLHISAVPNRGAFTGTSATAIFIVPNTGFYDYAFHSTTTGGKLLIEDTTVSTGTTTGSAVFGGGVGIAGDLFASTFTAKGVSSGLTVDDRSLGSTHGWTFFASGGSFSFFSSNGSTNRFSISDTTGIVSAAGGYLSTSLGLGYVTGAGGSVTQITSRNTGVTLNKITGDITLLAGVNAAISAATANTVIVTTSAVAAIDTPIVTQKSGTDKYLIFVTNVAAGSFTITFFTTGGTTNESPVFHYNIIKGAIT